MPEKDVDMMENDEELIFSFHLQNQPKLMQRTNPCSFLYMDMCKCTEYKNTYTKTSNRRS